MDEQQEALEDLIETVTGVGYFLDENLRQQFFEATSVDLDPDDERLDVLAMFVIANAVLRRIADNREIEPSLAGPNLEKLEWTRELVATVARDTLAAMTAAPGGKTAWSGPDDEDLLSFAYATIASTHINGLIVALDTIAEEGVDVLGDGPVG
ncbi:MAG: hypothetical protein ACKOWF_15840 [Chloroflexota bacterium]